MFADSYIKAGSHDGSTLEHEAERGRAIFYDFSKFLSKNKKYGSVFLRNLFHSKRSDSYKIGIIDLNSATVSKNRLLDSKLLL